MEIETLTAIGAGAGIVFAAFVTAFFQRVSKTKLWRKSAAPPAPPIQPPDFAEDTGVHLMRLVDAPDQQVQLRTVAELMGRVYKWTLEERNARSLDQLAREAQAQSAEAVQALALAADRERALNMQRDMRQTATLSGNERLESLAVENRAAILDIRRDVQRILQLLERQQGSKP